MQFCLAIFVVAALSVSCGSGDAYRAASVSSKEKASSTVEIEAPKSTGSTAEATVGASPETTSEASKPTTDAPFVDTSEAQGGSRFQADGILGVRFGNHEGFERLVVDLGAGKRAARRVPKWNLMSPEGDGLLRVSFPSVNATKVSDGNFGGALLKDFHVVRAPEGGMFVDVFSKEAFTYRVLELRDPARLVVDFKPSSASLSVPLPAEGGNTVVAEPRSGETVNGTLSVSGYSRNFEASNTIAVADANGKVIAKKTVSGNDWSETWGYFETTLDLPSFTGRGTLKVGTQSARDGAFEGVELPIRGG